MAFPSDHAFPNDLPVWRQSGYVTRAGERVEATAFEQGEDREREIRTFTPMMVSASLLLTQAQFNRFEAWVDDDLQAGSQRFDGRFASVSGRGLQWWQAMFVGPHRWTAMGRGFFVVTAEMILLDGPYDEENLPPGSSPGDPPRVAPSLSGRAYRDSAATANASQTGGLSGRTARDSEGWAITTNTLRGWSDRDSEHRVVQEENPYARLLDGALGRRVIDGDPTSIRRID